MATCVKAGMNFHEQATRMILIERIIGPHLATYDMPRLLRTYRNTSIKFMLSISNLT